MLTDENKQCLSGTWQFALDPEDRGRTEQWFHRPELFTSKIIVPGAFQAQGYGDNRSVNHLRGQSGIPPMVIEKTAYLGTAWYRREFSIPGSWHGKIIRVVFGGTHPLAEIWVDDNFIGKHKGSFLEHHHDITRYVTAGRQHTLTVRIAEFDQTKQSGQRNFGAVEGGTFNVLNWSGIYRDVWLEAGESSWIEQVLITPDIGRRQAQFKIRLAGSMANDCKLRVTVADGGGRPAAVLETAAVSDMDLIVPMRDVQLWSPEFPYLYHATISFMDQTGKIMDQTLERFGMRELAVDGQQVLLNGKPVFLRGYGDDQLYVYTLSPSLDRALLEKDLQQARDYGFNYVDFLYSVPHREYLDIADEKGIIIQCYPAQLIADADPYCLQPEYIREIVAQLYNHPSVAIYSVAAEKYGYAPEQSRRIEKLRKMVADADSTRLFATTGGIHRADAARDRTDIFEMMGDFTAIPEKLNVCRKPVVLHEYRWWSSYPDSRLKEKYKQSALRPFHIEYAEQAAHEKGLSDMLPVFVDNSQKLQALERKLGVERARRNPGIKGYAIWLGKDFKDSVEGIWDDFGEPKNVSAEEFRASNGETVLLIGHDELFRCYWDFEDIPIEVWMSHYGVKPIDSGAVTWRLEAAGDKTLLAAGMLNNISCPVGTANRIAEFRIRPESVARPVRAVLSTQLQAPGGFCVSNCWNFWLFPSLGELAVQEERDAEGNLIVTAGDSDVSVLTRIDDKFFQCVHEGRRIVLLTGKGVFKDRTAGFGSIIWNSRVSGQSGTVVANHPALGDFPHENYCDLQFYSMLKNANAIDLDDWPVKINPIIRAIASYKRCYNMGYLFEVKAGDACILVSSMDFDTTGTVCHTSSVEKQYLLYQLKKYAASDLFNPQAEVPMSFFKQYHVD